MNCKRKKKLQYLSCMPNPRCFGFSGVYGAPINTLVPPVQETGVQGLKQERVPELYDFRCPPNRPVVYGAACSVSTTIPLTSEA